MSVIVETLKWWKYGDCRSTDVYTGKRRGNSKLGHLISDFGKYDKENFMPDLVLKNQENKMENYPTNLKDSDMTGIDSTKTKNELIEKWEKVNG